MAFVEEPYVLQCSDEDKEPQHNSSCRTTNQNPTSHPSSATNFATLRSRATLLPQIITVDTEEDDDGETNKDELEISERQPHIDMADFECSLCFRLFCKPVSTSCGHTYCKNCLFAALRYNLLCPLCRTKLESPIKFKYSVNIVLMNVLEKHFQDAYKQREQEEEKMEDHESLANRDAANIPELEDYYSSWSSCLIPSVRATCCVLLSCT